MCFIRIVHSTSGKHFKNLLNLEVSMDIALEEIEAWRELNNPSLWLDISDLGLQILPPGIPDAVRFLNCSDNPIKDLSNLPRDLQILRCRHCEIESLENIPSHLEHLDCGNRTLKSVDNLPDTLKVLKLECCDSLEKIPNLPSELRTFFLTQADKIKTIPYFPPKLRYFYADYFGLESLPDLPESLTKLCCTKTKIKELPILPKRLKVLDCFWNDLRSLPELPEGLLYLDIWHNDELDSYDGSGLVIKTYNDLNHIVTNKIKKIKYLPKTIEFFSSTNIHYYPHSYMRNFI
jgi:hypothetical protein